ncbi:ectonucleoside triphosphate diphosphohydrolase 1-like [Montipora capricornis]|uniref:ectonucleoside triphosphate diphosphohydrolase 1-like n=1 Tax=Montipora capricornis TaxID=246305 RepID=UPI0035F217D6
MGPRSLFLLLMLVAAKLLTCESRRIHFKDQSIADSGPKKYAIVFDAGKTKTKLEIYKISTKSPPLDIRDVKQLDHSPGKVEPGIDSLAERPRSVEDYLTPLLNVAKSTVPEEKHNSTPLFFLATGGMRGLRADLANATLKEVKKLLSNKKKCPFKFDSKDARVISGDNEGMYGWITVNFLKGTIRPGNSKPTYGIIDLGGSSTQNEFESPAGNKTISVTFGDKKINLFSRSYLGYGLHLAYHRYLTMQMFSQQSLTKGIVKSPCDVDGLKENISIGVKEDVTVVGKASLKTCRAFIQESFFSRSPDSPFHDQPDLKGEIFGFAGIFYIARNLGLAESGEVKAVTVAMFEECSRKSCGKKYKDIHADRYAARDCFGSNFIYELLAGGYRLAEDKAIYVVDKLKGFDLGWGLGAMLYNTGLLG